MCRFLFLLDIRRHTCRPWKPVISQQNWVTSTKTNVSEAETTESKGMTETVLLFLGDVNVKKRKIRKAGRSLTAAH